MSWLRLNGADSSGKRTTDWPLGNDVLATDGNDMTDWLSPPQWCVVVDPLGAEEKSLVESQKQSCYPSQRMFVHI